MTKFYDGSNVDFNGHRYTWPSDSGTIGKALIKGSSGNIVWTTVESLLSRTTTINGSATGTTNLFTVPASQTVVITKATLRLVSQTGLTGTLRAGIGVASGEDDIFASVLLNGFNFTDAIYVYNALGLTLAVPQNSIIKLGIDTAFGGTTNLTLDLFGYYL